MSHKELSVADIHKLSLLCRIDLCPAEEEALRGDLDAILGHVDQLEKVDTKGVAPYEAVGLRELPLRPDAPRPSLGVEAALLNAPERLGDGFGVPKIIE